MLISLKPLGAEGSVNTEYVTSVEIEEHGNSRFTKLWIVGHMGYGTYSVLLKVSPSMARDYLNNPTAYLNKRHREMVDAVMRSIDAALSDDPPADWRASLSDAYDCIQQMRNDLE